MKDESLKFRRLVRNLRSRNYEKLTVSKLSTRLAPGKEREANRLSSSRNGVKGP